jgi:hypothetical protein
MGINVAKRILIKAKTEAKKQDKRRLKRQNLRLVKRQAKQNVNEVPALAASDQKQV